MVRCIANAQIKFEMPMRSEGWNERLTLTLVLLNKLSLPHPFLTVNQSDNSILFVHINSQTE